MLVSLPQVLEKSTTLYHFVEDKPFFEWFTAHISLFPQQDGRDYFDELHAQRSALPCCLYLPIHITNQ
jgi:phage terminase large subunit GpA-like protein